jgi:hypothetical protein
VVEAASSIFYDGAMRERAVAIERIERDGTAYLARAVADFERDDGAWLLLIEELNVPTDLDDPDLGTFARATFDALSSRAWCSSPSLARGSVEWRVCGLDPATAERIEKSIALRARRTEDAMKRAIAQLASVVAPAELPRSSAALQLAAERVVALATAKMERVRAACDCVS